MPQTNVIIEIRPVLLFTLYNTKNIAYHITEELIFDADKIMVMDSYKNLHVFNFMILLKLQKSRKFDAHEIYMFYGSWAQPDPAHLQLTLNRPTILLQSVILDESGWKLVIRI